MTTNSTCLVADTNYSYKVFFYSSCFHYENLPIASQQIKNKKFVKKKDKNTTLFQQNENIFSEISQNSLVALDCGKFVVYCLLRKAKHALYFIPRYVVFAGVLFIISVAGNAIFAKQAYAKNVPPLSNSHPIGETAKTQANYSTNQAFSKIQVKSLPTQNTPSSTDFNILIGFGSSISTSNQADVSVQKLDFKEISLELSQLLETNKTQNIIDSSVGALNSLTLYIKCCLQPILTHYEIEELTLTSTNLMTPTRSGLTGITTDGRLAPLSRNMLNKFMSKRGLGDLYPVMQQTLDASIHFKQQIEYAQNNHLNQNIPQIVESFIQKLPPMSENTNVSIKPCVNIQPLKAQLYGKFIHPFNCAASFDFQSQQFSLGVGKAGFYKLGNLSNNFGVIAGVDFGVNFRFTPFNTAQLSPKLGANAFLGLGLRF